MTSTRCSLNVNAMQETWQAWLIAGGVLFILELFTPGFVLAVFGGACVITALPAALGAPLWVLIVTFIVSTIGFAIGVRPVLLRKTGAPPARTNADALVGREGKVVEAVDNRSSSGRVLVEGDDWRAVSETDETIALGEQVIVKRVESNRLHVSRRP